MVDPPARVTVNGLDMTIVMFARIMTTIRGKFPDLVEGLSDEAAIQVVMLSQMVEFVSDWESQTQAPDPTAAAQAAIQEAIAARTTIAETARAEVLADIKLTTTT